MVRYIELVGIYRLAVSFVVTRGCLGKTFRIEVVGRRGSVTLPVLTWASGGYPTSVAWPFVTLPAIAAPPQSSGPSRIHPNRFGGNSAGYPVFDNFGSFQHVRVSAVRLHFRVPQTNIAVLEEAHRHRPSSGAIPEAIRTGIEPWFYRLQAWIEVVAGRGAIRSREGTLSTEGRLSLFTSESSSVEEVDVQEALPTPPLDNDPVSLSKLRRIVTQANAGNLPSDSHLLLRDAHAALCRGSLRLAVLDAGTGVELALAALAATVPNLNVPSKATLGWYVTHLHESAQLPASTNADLVDLRNDAVHDNKQPTRAKAEKALAIAKQVIDKVDPLPL